MDSMLRLYLGYTFLAGMGMDDAINCMDNFLIKEELRYLVCASREGWPRLMY